jgi:MtrB/PioB family decaheme-associated outer membrane protein
MQTQKTRFHRTLLTLGLLAAFGPAHADEAVDQLIKPSSSITVGASAVSGDSVDRANFGQYNGMRKNKGQPQLDVDFLKRDDATGTWTALTGRNLGNENRELGFSQQKQGDWRYQFEYGELVRNYSNTINTNLQGIGTSNLTVVSLGAPPAAGTVDSAATIAALRAAQGTGANVDLKTTRKALGVNVDKWLTPYLQLEVNFKNEEKKGARMFGRGQDCSAGNGCVTNVLNLNTYGAMLMLPEPINSTTRQIEAKLNYSDDKLAVNGGYYGTFFVNKFGSLTETFAGQLWLPAGSGFDPRTGTGNSLQASMAPLALPPDNQAHQFSVAGTYAFTPTTRATFKYAFTRLTQNEAYGGMGLVGSPRSALDAVVDTSVAQIGVTARPLPKLSVLANFRYEQKSDKTPFDFYKSATRGNSPTSHTKMKGKLEASYQLPDGYRATGGIDYDFRDLGVPNSLNDTSQQAFALRAKNDEIGVRGELRKSLVDNLSGTVSAAHSVRTGSAWMFATNGQVLTGAGGAPGTGFNLYPLFWADLTRDKVKVAFDWEAAKDLTLQASADTAAERYYAPTFRGARDGKTTNLNFDASYKLSDKWKMNGWYSRGDTILDLNQGSGGYQTNMRQLGHNLGLGVRGAPSGDLELGADFTFSYEVNRTSLGVTTTSTQGNELPVVAFRQVNLNMFAKYALDKSADIKVSVAHQRYYSNEWYWNNAGTNFFFSDGTTVTQKDQQNVTFVGAAYIYKFQ